MKRLLKRILLVTLVLGSVAAIALAIALSHNSPCGDVPPLADGTPRMQAIVHRCYGPPEVLKLEEIAKPTPNDDEVLVKVYAAAVNPLDWHFMRGTPYIMRLSSGFGAPDEVRAGVDFSGKVEAVGANVTRFKPGDEVFGGRTGAFAEYVVVREDLALVLKPANISFAQAAAMPIAAVTALQGLRNKGGIKPGHQVLINGASGGVGTFAVQIAKLAGAEVTAVCSTRNVDLVRTLGADHVIDYTQEDFTEKLATFDLILDNVGNRSLTELRRALKPSGTLVIIGGQSDDPWLGPMLQPLKAMVVSPFVNQQMSMLLAELNQKDLEVLAQFMEAGKLTSVIDRYFSLSDVPAAIAYLEEGRARGKVVISLE